MKLPPIIPWPNARDRFWRQCRKVMEREAAEKLEFLPSQIEYAMQRLEAIDAAGRMLGEHGPHSHLSRDAVWFLIGTYGEIWRLTLQTPHAAESDG